jgi:hypothetical protein
MNNHNYQLIDISRVLELSGILSESYTLLEALEDNVANDPKFKDKILARYQQDTHKPTGAENLTTELDIVRWIAANFLPPQGNAVKYLPRVVDWYIRGAFFLHDAPQLAPLIAYFGRLGKDNQMVKNKDIFSKEYNDFRHFLEIVDAARLSGSAAGKKMVAQAAQVHGLAAYGTMLIDTPDFKAVKLGSKTQAMAFWSDLLAPYKGEDASGRWCITVRGDQNMWDSYKCGSGQDAIALVAGSGSLNTAATRKFMYGFEQGQFMDETNQEIKQVDIEMLSKLPGYTEFLNQQIKKHYHAEQE